MGNIGNGTRQRRFIFIGLGGLTVKGMDHFGGFVGQIAKAALFGLQQRRRGFALGRLMQILGDSMNFLIDLIQANTGDKRG